MIVRRNSENRNGATLIVNEAELEYIWHKLNCANGTKFMDYATIKHYTHKDVNAADIWRDLDRKFTPQGE